jgi:LAGLIDADG endonuclease
MEGLRKIVAIKASLNKGLSEELKAEFPNNIPVTRPEVNLNSIKDPNWLAGFTTGEGSFLISIFKSKTLTGYAVRLRFNLTQHSRDTQLMKSLVDYLGCGRYVTAPLGYNHGEFIVSNLSDITKIIIPFFKKYPIKGNKSRDFSDFCKAAQIMENKAHLTSEGLDQIRLINSSMNNRRET